MRAAPFNAIFAVVSALAACAESVDLREQVDMAFKNPDLIPSVFEDMPDTDRDRAVLWTFRRAVAEPSWRAQNREAYETLRSALQASERTADILSDALEETMEVGKGRRRENRFMVASEIDTPALAEVVARYLWDERSFPTLNADGEALMFPFAPRNDLLAMSCLTRMGCIDGPDLEGQAPISPLGKVEMWKDWWIENYGDPFDEDSAAGGRIAPVETDNSASVRSHGALGSGRETDAFRIRGVGILWFACIVAVVGALGFLLFRLRQRVRK